MKVEVLISCMYQSGREIISRTNIQTDAVVVNQCDTDSREEFTFSNKSGERCRALIINSRGRGLSKSRNRAIANSSRDILLLCDDDEILNDDYSARIVRAFRENNDSIIAFRFDSPKKSYPNAARKINIVNAGRLTSHQIAMRRDDIVSNGIRFNEKMGSGTGNGAGEENKFVVDCLKKGLTGKYVPELIGRIVDGQSQWFSGYNKKYWIDRGWAYKMIHGRVRGLFFVASAIFRARKIDRENSIFEIAGWLFDGFMQKR